MAMLFARSQGRRAGAPVFPHVDVSAGLAPPTGAGDPAFEVPGPAAFAPLRPARGASRYAAVDALVTLAAAAGFVATLGVLARDVAGASARQLDTLAKRAPPQALQCVVSALAPLLPVHAI